MGPAVAWNRPHAASELSSLLAVTLTLPGAHFSLNVLDSKMGPRIFSLACLSGSNMMMATNYSNKQNLENHWLTPTISKVLSASGPWPGPTLPCFLWPGSCIHLNQPLKLGIFHIKVQIPGFLGRRPSGPSSSQVAEFPGTHTPCSLRPHWPISTHLSALPDMQAGS